MCGWAICSPGAGVGEGGGGGVSTAEPARTTPTLPPHSRSSNVPNNNSIVPRRTTTLLITRLTNDTRHPHPPPSRTPIPHSNNESRYQLPPLNLNPGATGSLASSNSSFTSSFQSAKQRESPLSLTLPTPPGSKPWLTKGENGLLHQHSAVPVTAAL